MKYRWESYVKYHGKDELAKFCKEFYGDNPEVKVLFLLGKGFDPRMNNTLTLLLENVKGLQLDCPSRINMDSPSPRYRLTPPKVGRSE